LLLHLLVVVVAGTCLLAGRWQLHSALSGNDLSWAYTVEWPIFAAIAVIGWWQLIRESPAERAERAARAARDVASGERAGGRGAPNRCTAGPMIATEDGVETPEAYAERVGAAARREYLSHLARLADDDPAKTWRRSAAES
jgi:hypothetical protein